MLPLGLALVILAGELATLTDATAELAAPLAAGLAIAGLLLGPIRRSRPDLWALGAALAVFVVFAAPVVLSGEATFAGYIKLDDTATYFAMTDRVMEHARDLAGLAPSTYEATLATTLAVGYPTGVLMPIGIGHALVGYDLAWIFQPYIAFLAAMLALSLYALLEPLVPLRPMRAFAAFVAAQPAILFGYSLWGGIKELAGAWLFALLAVLVPWTLGPRSSARAVLPLAAVCAAIVCVLSLPAAAWLLPAALVAVVLLVRRPVRSVPLKLGRLRGGRRRARGAGNRRGDRLAAEGVVVPGRDRARQPVRAAEQAAGARDLARRRLPRPSARHGANVRAARTRGRRRPARALVGVAPRSLGASDLSRHRRARLGRGRRRQLPLGEREGDRDGGAGFPGRGARRVRGALRARAARRGGGRRRSRSRAACSGRTRSPTTTSRSRRAGSYTSSRRSAMPSPARGPP